MEHSHNGGASGGAPPAAEGKDAVGGDVSVTAEQQAVEKTAGQVKDLNKPHVAEPLTKNIRGAHRQSRLHEQWGAVFKTPGSCFAALNTDSIGYMLDFFHHVDLCALSNVEPLLVPPVRKEQSRRDVHFAPLVTTSSDAEQLRVWCERLKLQVKFPEHAHMIDETVYNSRDTSLYADVGEYLYADYLTGEPCVQSTNWRTASEYKDERFIPEEVGESKYTDPRQRTTFVWDAAPLYAQYSLMHSFVERVLKKITLELHVGDRLQNLAESYEGMLLANGYTDHLELDPVSVDMMGRAMECFFEGCFVQGGTRNMDLAPLLAGDGMPNIWDTAPREQIFAILVDFLYGGEDDEDEDEDDSSSGNDGEDEEGGSNGEEDDDDMPMPNFWDGMPNIEEGDDGSSATEDDGSATEDE